MKPDRSIVAARPLAQHCAELVRAAPGIDDLTARLETCAGKLARSLVAALAPLAGGKGLAIKARPARQVGVGDLILELPGLAACTLMGLGAEALPLVAALDAAAVLRMVDRTFGGRGAAPEPLPAEFPGSADLMIGRLEGLVATHLAAALALPGTAPLLPLRRAGLLDELEAFPGHDRLVLVDLQVTEPGGDSWPITLLVPPATLAALFAGPAPRPASPRRAADPLARPFADVSLACSAVLVDMRMSMKTLAALRPGTLLPVAVARQVPLRICDSASDAGGGDGPILATGTVGAAEDRVALQINTAF
ncbi:flagellar motor switch protein FliM [Novosphingobium bradum]|uniref:Flagellar motor switch protein FliM n=1 Tax=Novosphingobium bradum TaxID=1737444 RepID=A0ABV7IRN9_9SPHN